jgi:predicted transcriptional regulator
LRKEKLGAQELEVLRFVSDHAPVTVREVAERFAVERGLARTTMFTVMERLRAKGFLVRESGEGGYAYRPVQAKTEMLRNLVGDFVERTLGGSLTPFVAYLAERRETSPEEIEQLRALVKELEKDGDDSA